MKIIIISIHNWAIHYLKESLNSSQLKKTTLITDKLTNEIKKFLNLNIQNQFYGNVIMIGQGVFTRHKFIKELMNKYK